MGSTPYPDLVFGSIGQNVLSPLLVGPILRLKCLCAQCISNTTRVCLKALEKHFFLLPPCAVVATTVALSGKRDFFLGVSLVATSTLKYL